MKILKRLFKRRKLCEIYSCSKCGNEFFGLTSLGKHWDEKHNEND